MAKQHHFNRRSLRRLKGVHSDLVLTCVLALQFCPYDLMVVEGVRDKKTQKQYVLKGVSKTMDSKHLTGDAVDLAPIVDGDIPWEDREVFAAMAKAMKDAAFILGVDIEWGGDWKSFYDGPHFQR